jgi:hypothetical protein
MDRKPCHRLLRHRAIKALVIRLRDARARGDVFASVMLEERLHREFAA